MKKNTPKTHGNVTPQNLLNPKTTYFPFSVQAIDDHLTELDDC